MPKHELLTQADREKRWVALSSLLAAVLLTGTKLGIGLWTNSLGILSEAAHSGLDLVAAAVTLWAVRVSGRPADREHAYGHGKIENLSALFETVLLVGHLRLDHQRGGRPAVLRRGSPRRPERVGVSGGSAVDRRRLLAIPRLEAGRRQVRQPGARGRRPALLHRHLVVGGRAAGAVRRVGERAAGSALADPGRRRGGAGRGDDRDWRQPEARQEVGRRSARQRAGGLHDQVAAAAKQVPGVEEVTRLRLRRSGPEIFADVTLAVGHTAAFERAHDIANEVEAAVHAVLPNADVVVHVEPIAPGEEDVTTIVRLLAARHGLGAHGIRIYEENRQRWLELHLEVSDSLLLDEAHRQATEFERALRQSLPGVTRIVTHIEPTGDAAATIRSQPAGQLQVQKAIGEFLRDYPLAGQAARRAGAIGRRGTGRLVPLHARRRHGHHRGPRSDRPARRVSPQPRAATRPGGDPRGAGQRRRR